MKCIILGIICHLSLSLFCQVVVGKEWTIECGASSKTGFSKPSSLNLRCVSPRFKWSEDWTEEDEKHPEKYKNKRLMFELIYQAPLKVLSIGFNVQQRFIKYKAFSMEIYGGPKFFFVPGPDFSTIPYLKGGKNAWYINVGIICQFNLAVIAPYADFGGDGILTLGTEINFNLIYKKIKKKFNPPYIQS